MNIRSLLGAGAVILAVLLAWLLATDPGTANDEAPRGATAPLPREPASEPSERSGLSPLPAPVAPWEPPTSGETASRARDPLPALASPLASVVDDLRGRAREGDAGAACRLAFELERCRRLPSARSAARRLRAWSRDDALPEPARQRQALSADFFESLVTRDEPVCQGIEPARTTGAWRYLLQAAQAGHVPSGVRFARGLALLDGAPPGRNLDGWIALRDHGPGFLEAGVAGGEAEAYDVARLAYSLGEILGIPFPHDPVRSVALSLALAEAGTPEERERSLGNARFVAERSGLTGAQAAEARAQAKSLAVRLLARHAPGSVDFTRGTFARDDGSHCGGTR